MAGPLLKASTLENAYAGFWNAFDRGGPRVIRPLYSNGFKTTVGVGNNVEVRGVFYFAGWPYHNRNSDGVPSKVDIVTEGRDTYDCVSGCVSRSSVKIRYTKYHTKEAERALLLQLHYDFQLDQGPQHPVFHAQFGHVKFADAELKELGVPTVAAGSNAMSYPSVRIPTPFVGLPGLLVTLAADHWPSKEFKKFLAHAGEANVVRNWSPMCDSLHTSFSRHKRSIHNYHWYGHEAGSS